MPPWGRPPGGRAGVGRYMEEAEDVYRFQEIDSDDEKNGVMVEPGYQRFSAAKQFNPDELYFNDMDLRAWERRTAELDGMAYGDDYGFQEDEGYYDDGPEVTMSQAEYEELVFQRVLDRIRLARATGEPDVQMTEEELEVYQVRLGLRQRAPAARPQVQTRPVSAPAISGGTNNAVTNTSSSTTKNSSGSTRSKRGQQRTSLFSSRPKKEKPGSRKRASSNATATTNQSNQTYQTSQSGQAPGFVVPDANGQPIFAPINVYAGRLAGEGPLRPSGSPSRSGSRSASLNGRQAPTPPRITPVWDVPGAFPSGSPTRYQRESTPPRQGRPPSSSSRQSSIQDQADLQSNNRSPSGSVQQTVKLVPFPVTDYQHFTAEPYQYQVAGQVAPSVQPPSQSSPQSQYVRRAASGPVENPYMAMPRRVPVPVQRAPAPTAGVQSSYSDPNLPRTSGARPEVSEDDGGILVDVIPEADDKRHTAQTMKSGAKEASGSSSSSSKDSEKRRRAGRTRRKL
ncbi:hypothetical protein CC78DRAFT_579117 [Lojkania enalia]|uniref:Uncharacterized protein n=1 Tax=Lojkania enalia TaxID=147567 RepID=A0A9P4N729_9PLEO|nr:hypothetical protein CC78DRAFT_579117 [Didymosphaeria enalia]